MAQNHTQGALSSPLPQTMEQNHTYNDTTTQLIFLFSVVAGFFLWSFFVGTCLARLWFYDGALDPKFKKFDIQPEYIRERLTAEQRRASQRVVDSALWNGDVATMSFEAVKEIDSLSLRERIFEEKRVSRLPAFVQDDGGDGSEFPDMPVDMSADEYNKQYFPKRFEHPRELGLQELERGRWVSIDGGELRTARDQILARRYEACVQVRPGKETENACEELLQEVASFLSAKYPARFWEQKEAGARKLWDDEERLGYALEKPFEIAPLDTVARLVCEDFCVFFKSAFSMSFMLQATATCCPSGWRARVQIGQAVDNQRDLVLPWEKLPEILSYVDDHHGPYKRHVTFIQTAHPNDPDVTKKYFVQAGKDFFSGNISFLRPDTLQARIERQMFMRLPKSGAIVMTTKLQISPLAMMAQKKLRYLAKEIRSWPAHMARLKGRDLWARAVLGYIEDFPMAHDDRTVVDPGELTEEE